MTAMRRQQVVMLHKLYSEYKVPPDILATALSTNINKLLKLFRDNHLPVRDQQQSISLHHKRQREIALTNASPKLLEIALGHGASKREISQICDIPVTSLSIIIDEHKLQPKKYWPSSALPNVIKLLRDKGYSFNQIGKLFEKSTFWARQHIE